MSASPVLIFSGRGCARLAGEFAVGAGERPGDRAPEQVGRGGDKSVRGKFVGEIAQILVDAVHGTREHHRRHLARRLRHREIAIEIAARASVDLDGLARTWCFAPVRGLEFTLPAAFKARGGLRTRSSCLTGAGFRRRPVIHRRKRRKAFVSG